MPPGTQLARVQTSRPRLLVLPNNTNTNSVAFVVQIRPTVLHYVHDRVRMCVVTSTDEICGITSCDDSSMPIVMVTTRSGHVWLVRLPSTPMGIKPTVLDERFHTRNPAVRRLVDVPGAQDLVYLADLDLLVCTSLLVPTTVVRGVVQSPQKFHVEVDDLEGERSTCLCVFSIKTLAHLRLVTWLVRTTRRSTSTPILIVQGDADGSVRCALLDADGHGNVERVTELTRLPEPIHTILPVRVEEGAGADALLVIGTKGSVALLSQARVCFGRFEVPVTSVAFIDGDESFIVVSTVPGKGFTIAMAEFCTQLGEKLVVSSKSKGILAKATQLGSYEDVLLVSTRSNASTTMISLLTRSGQLISLPRDECTKSRNTSTAGTNLTTPTDQRVKTLLQDISRLSEKSVKLEEISKRTDALLHGFNAAVNFVRIAEERGIDSVVTCSLRLKLVDQGWAMQSKGVCLLVTLQFTELLLPARLAESAMWRVQIAVGGIRAIRISSYGLPLHECVGVERCIQLDESVLLQLDGIAKVSCDLVFAPDVVDTDVNGSSVIHPVSFAIPIVQGREFHLVQLSEPATDFPMNPVAVRETLTQVQAMGSRATARQGYEWWTTLVEDAVATGVMISGHDARDAPAPPLRFVIRISNNPTTSSGLKEEDVLAMFSHLMDIDKSESERWRPACRYTNGKWWIGLRTFAGNLVVLRFATVPATSGSEDDTTTNNCVEITVYASKVADLSAIRAVLLHAESNQDLLKSKSSRQWKQHDLEHVSIALTKARAELDSLAVMASDIVHKISNSTISGRHPSEEGVVDVCQDEMLQLLRRTAQVETRTLEIYWKSREILGQHLPL